MSAFLTEYSKMLQKRSIIPQWRHYEDLKNDVWNKVDVFQVFVIPPFSSLQLPNLPIFGVVASFRILQKATSLSFLNIRICFFFHKTKNKISKQFLPYFWRILLNFRSSVRWGRVPTFTHLQPSSTAPLALPPRERGRDQWRPSRPARQRAQPVLHRGTATQADQETANPA